MPKFDKPDSPNIIWGVNALEEDLTRPSDSKIQTGWIQEKPPYEFENYSMNKLYQGFAYYNQLGFPEWDSVTEYQAGKSYVQASNDRVYKCIQTHTNRNPAMAGNEDWWEVFEGNRQATTASRGTVELATNSEARSGSSSSLSLTPANLFGILGQASLLGNGYVKIPVRFNGSVTDFIVQWGSVTIDAPGSASASFPLEFPNTVFHAYATRSANNLQDSSRLGFSTDVTNSKVDIYSASDATSGITSVRWFAIGY